MESLLLFIGLSLAGLPALWLLGVIGAWLFSRDQYLGARLFHQGFPGALAGLVIYMIAGLNGGCSGPHALICLPMVWILIGGPLGGAVFLLVFVIRRHQSRAPYQKDRPIQFPRLPVALLAASLLLAAVITETKSRCPVPQRGQVRASSAWLSS